MREREEARAEFEVTLDARPSFAGARVRLGVVLQRQGDTQGDTQGAVRAWKQCAAEDPEDMLPRAYLASAGVSFPCVHESEASKEAG